MFFSSVFESLSLFNYARRMFLPSSIPSLEEIEQQQQQPTPSLATALVYMAKCRAQLEQTKTRQQFHRRLLLVSFAFSVPMIILSHYCNWTNIRDCSIMGTTGLAATALLNFYSSYRTHQYSKQLHQQHQTLLRSKHYRTTSRTTNRPQWRIFPCTIHLHPHPQVESHLIDSPRPTPRSLSRPGTRTADSPPDVSDLDISPLHPSLGVSSSHPSPLPSACSCLCPHCVTDFTEIALTSSIVCMYIWGLRYVLFTGGIRSPVLSCMAFYPILIASWLPSPRAPVFLGVPTVCFVLYCLYYADSLRAMNELLSHGEWCINIYSACIMCMCLLYSIGTAIHSTLATSHDRSMLESARQRADAAHQQKFQSMANLSHEVRTPMTGILGACELIMEEHLTPEAATLARLISQSATALLGTVNDILEFSRLESGDTALSDGRFNLRQLINEIHGVYTPTALQKHIELVVVYPAECPALFIADHVRIRQILMNLVGNALKFTSRGHVRVCVAHRMVTSEENDPPMILPPGTQPCEVTVSVHDTGMGITHSAREQFLTSFTDQDLLSHPLGGTAGLGLAISRKLARLMSGDISYDSVVGRGSSFHFRVPLPMIVNDPAQPPIVSHSGEDISPTRINTPITSTSTTAATVPPPPGAGARTRGNNSAQAPIPTILTVPMQPTAGPGAGAGAAAGAGTGGIGNGIGIGRVAREIRVHHLSPLIQPHPYASSRSNPPPHSHSHSHSHPHPHSHPHSLPHSFSHSLGHSHSRPPSSSSNSSSHVEFAHLPQLHAQHAAAHPYQYTHIPLPQRPYDRSIESSREQPQPRQYRQVEEERERDTQTHTSQSQLRRRINATPSTNTQTQTQPNASTIITSTSHATTTTTATAAVAATATATITGTSAIASASITSPPSQIPRDGMETEPIQMNPTITPIPIHPMKDTGVGLGFSPPSTSTSASTSTSTTRKRKQTSAAANFVTSEPKRARADQRNKSSSSAFPATSTSPISASSNSSSSSISSHSASAPASASTSSSCSTSPSSSSSSLSSTSDSSATPTPTPTSASTSTSPNASSNPSFHPSLSIRTSPFTASSASSFSSSSASFLSSSNLVNDPAVMALFKGKRILLAEDNVINSKIVCKMLAKLGIQISISWNGREAFEACTQQTVDQVFDAILMDMQMPELGGCDAARLIRKIPEYTTVPIIALTANVLDVDRQACGAAGMTGFISKPVSLPSLIDQLGRALLHATSPSPSPSPFTTSPIDRSPASTSTSAAGTPTATVSLSLSPVSTLHPSDSESTITTDISSSNHHPHSHSNSSSHSHSQLSSPVHTHAQTRINPTKQTEMDTSSTSSSRKTMMSSP